MVERVWRLFFDMVRCLLIDVELFKQLWIYVVMILVYIWNRCYNFRIGKIFYEYLIGIKFNLFNMYVFGIVCYVYV